MLRYYITHLGRLTTRPEFYLVALIALCAPAIAPASELKIFVSIVPEKTLVARIAGNHASTNTLVTAGMNPHTYEFTPQQLRALSETNLYFYTGLPFEERLLPRLKTISPLIRVVDLRKGLTLRRTDEPVLNSAHLHDDHNHGVMDPHFWTDPLYAKIMAATIRDALCDADPSHQADYRANYQRVADQLDRLDQTIRQRLAALPQRRFMVFHPAWGYFADRYELTQIPVEVGGREPSGRLLTQLIDLAKKEQLKTVFIQPQTPTRAARAVASAIGGKVVVIDPLAEDYFDNLLRVTDALLGENLAP